ncbi:spore gernimation protein [Alteribacter lacisalsi]|uniref:Spore gernimation protein n=1 Tax=Alteribacter lacisalsi TaxID=2045244 RepID=A0A2W0H8V8_9BACI|nr:LysM peptidoglycan-binding domain-containing protein [Alteribacter lacisalsi]PYZ98293.1 spore gernimation protein [Alteribacter lacisalsi]
MLHQVRPGDTLYSLAIRYNSNVEQIVRGNGLYPPFTENFLIYPGQQLVIPVRDSGRSVTLYVVNPGETLTQAGNLFSASYELIAGINDTIQNPDYLIANQQIIIPAVVYEVREGSSLFGISQEMGVPLDSILRANRNRPAISADLIYPGTLLIVPLPVSVNIAVFDPLPGTVISDGSLITGIARAFEGTVLLEVTDSAGRVIAEEWFTTAASGAPAYAPFLTTVNYDRIPAEEKGFLQVYTRSAKDNTVQDLVSIPVRFKDENS